MDDRRTVTMAASGGGPLRTASGSPAKRTPWWRRGPLADLVILHQLDAGWNGGLIVWA
ncbi:MAG TPA: hypothetical protein VJT32_10605 [bacterium]|nr:hypothetical protein [bacterium]